MNRKLGLLKLVDDEAVVLGTAPLPKSLLDAKGIPSDAKEVRRYCDVSNGRQCAAIVLEHSSFPEVEDGGHIPELKNLPAVVRPTATETHAPKHHAGHPKK